MRRLLARVKEIAVEGTIDEIAERVTGIMRHLIERWPRLNSLDRQQLAGLRSVAFLPAAIGGKRVQSKRYPPSAVYRAARAQGFSSQVPVVELAPLRQATATVTELLDLLAMPAEPPTDKVVAHLEHCMATGTAVSDLTYAILSERMEGPDAACIDRLAGTDFIYVAEQDRFLSAGSVFWIPPPFGGRWHAASPRMRLREPLYRHLGVADQPGPVNYAALLMAIAGTAQPANEDVAVHTRCLAWLAEALDRGEVGADEAVGELADQFALLNLDGRPVWGGDAIWVDSQWLVAPFGETLNERLVAQPAVPRAAAARLFRRLGVDSVTRVARLRLAAPPDNRPADGATDRLQERSDLLLWLAPNAELRAGLRTMLARIEVRLSERLLVHSEILEFEPPVRSSVVSAGAFYDAETGVLHVRSTEQRSMDWPAAFRALFAMLESQSQGVEMPPIVMAAAFVTSAATWEDAERALRQSDYSPPADFSGDLPRGGILGDTPEEPEHGSGSSEDGATFGDEPETIDSEVDKFGDGDDASDATGRGRSHESGRAHNDQAGTGRPAGDPDAEDRHGVANEGRFRSKADDGTFGAQPGDKGERTTRTRDSGAGKAEVGTTTPGGSGGGAPRRRDTSAERQERRSRMLTYVVASVDTSDAGKRTGDDHDASEEIDLAAIAAALKYERMRGWAPEEQPHGNPGYDIVSMPPRGAGRRLIEVKGLEGDWTERGIKLSHVQYGMAEAYPDDFWIYVVENTRDLQRQKVTAIANPFSKVEEYWFDERWRHVSEEAAGSREINVQVGARVRHSIWGVGTIVAVDKRGRAPFLTIDFGKLEGRRGVPLSRELDFVD